MNQLLAALRQGEPLPPQVVLPTELVQTFDALWQRSLITPIREWGATIVETAGGGLAVGVEIEGKEGDIQFPHEEMAQTGCVGAFHTHPYEDGTAAVAFSDNDFAWFIVSQKSFFIVQCGEDRFLIGQRASSETKEVDYAALRERYYSMVVEIQERDNERDVVASYQNAVFETNVALCRQLGLCFYYGRGITLERVVGGDR